MEEKRGRRRCTRRAQLVALLDPREVVIETTMVGRRKEGGHLGQGGTTHPGCEKVIV
jgi:hypothetical protein